jgi:hypothetical protein
MNEKLLKALQGQCDDMMVKLIAQVGALADVAVSQATAGATGVSAGQSSQTTQTGAAHKNDISVPELMEASMGSLAEDIAHMGKVNARTFDLGSLAGSFAAFTAGSNAGAQMGNVTTQQNEEYSRRKDAGTVRLVALTDLGKEVADDSGGK